MFLCTEDFLSIQRRKTTNLLEKKSFLGKYYEYIMIEIRIIF